MDRAKLKADIGRASDFSDAYRFGQVGRPGSYADYSYREWSEKVADLLPQLIEAAKIALRITDTQSAAESMKAAEPRIAELEEAMLALVKLCYLLPEGGELPPPMEKIYEHVDIMRRLCGGMAGAIEANYDKQADVLYVALDQPRAAISEEGRDGLIYRFAMDNEQPCGITVTGYRDIWSGKERDLAQKIGVFLCADTNEVRKVILRETTSDEK